MPLHMQAEPEGTSRWRTARWLLVPVLGLLMGTALGVGALWFLSRPLDLGVAVIVGPHCASTMNMNIGLWPPPPPGSPKYSIDIVPEHGGESLGMTARSIRWVGPFFIAVR